MNYIHGVVLLVSCTYIHVCSHACLLTTHRICLVFMTNVFIRKCTCTCKIKRENVESVCVCVCVHVCRLHVNRKLHLWGRYCVTPHVTATPLRRNVPYITPQKMLISFWSGQREFNVITTEWSCVAVETVCTVHPV